jgi:hypothetical protein
VSKTEREFLPLQITHTYTYCVCAENSTIELPCEKYNETKYIIVIHYLASKFTKTPINPRKTRGVSHCGLAIYINKSIIRQKKNYGNSSISPCKNIIFKTIL